MIGWRRRAKAARESTVSQERLYELVNQTLMENFGPLGSFSITRRSASDTDDIFHTALARSVSRDIVANLAEHGITVKSSTQTVAAQASPSVGRTVGDVVAAPSSRVHAPGRAVAAFTSLAPVDAVPVSRQLARAVSAALSPDTSPVPAYPTVAAGVAIGAVPIIDGPDPLDDDALRSLVAHHAEVAKAAAKRAGRPGGTTTIAI